ncbi:hypothetical protein [Rhodospirillum sp. A1_3_36]|uniref:hypothetical protein n=1 Tax=Rhodospirillum sp. A1_3_36 TaxID=3391666 RepID=UPI0039A41193
MTKDKEVRALALLYETQLVLYGDPQELADRADDLKTRLHDLLEGDLAQALVTLSTSGSMPSLR